MDLINELEGIEDNELPVDNLIQNLEEEQIRIGIKIHILKVINISRAFTQLIDSDIPKDKIAGINLAYHQDSNNCKFSIHLFDDKEKRLKMDAKFKENLKSLVESLRKLIGKINPSYVSESFWEDKQGNILFNKEVDKQIYDLFLNERIKTILSYSQLSVKLKDKEESQKKPKI